MREVKSIVKRQKEFFGTDRTKSVDFRLQMLQRLEDAIRANEELILSALYEDLSKSRAEAYMSELAMVYAELRDARKHVKKWSRPQRVRGTVSTFPARNYIYREPYGVVLILAPWNYPFNLTIAPLVAAIAAGNCAVLKCSKESRHTARVLGKLLNTTFTESYIFCVDADTEYDEVLHQRYDYIFFTGSARVGRLILRAASEDLIPVSLELGGKSPCIVDETADLRLAAKRIAWGKLLNAGQTCIAVDYVVVHNRVKEKFIQALREEIARRYPDAVNNETYPKIINERHYERLLALIEAEREVIGGQRNDAARRIEPTILPHADFDHEIMQEEIFGPLLPVIGYDDIGRVLDTIKAREKPLACYIFSQKKENAERIISSLSYGGGCVNDVVVQIANHRLPFGGVGHSGMGSYHGRYGFETFSHKKSVVRNTALLDVPTRYAPFNEKKLKELRRLLRS